MKIKTLLSPLNVDELFFTGKATVVIDVLRATTTIISALNNGAKEIIPVGSIEFAMKASGDTFSGQTILAGERNTKKIDGFALGNSPFEYENEVVNGKSIILFTTNGSRAIVKAKYSAELVIASFLNIRAVAQYLNQRKEIEIFCSGNNGLFSYEDSMCAGGLINDFINVEKEVELDDASKICLFLFQKHNDDLVKALKETEHGSKLISEGFSEDIDFSASLNSVEIIPLYKAGSIKLKN